MTETKTESAEIKTYKCAKCGIKSTVKEAFLEKHGLFSQGQTLCFECWTKDQTATHLGNYLWLFGLGLFTYFVIPDSWFRLLYFQILAGLLLMMPLIFLHELAHALAARLLGLRVFAVSLGVGRVMFSLRFLGFKWYLHPLLISGATSIAGLKKPGYRLRLALVILAGPALHALLIGLVLLAQPYQVGPGFSRGFWLDQLLIITLWTNVSLLLFNLFPRKVSLPNGATGTDGWMIFHTLTRPAAELEKKFAQYYTLEAVDAVDRGDLPAAKQWSEQGIARYPENVEMLNTVGYVQSFLNESEKAREVFLRVLAHSEAQSALMQCIAKNNIAYANLLLDDPALIDEADTYSAQAYQNLPWEPIIMGTRGAVLVWMGQLDQGIELLKSAMAKSADRHGKGSDACFVALGELRRGNTAEAQRYLASARQLYTECPLIERVEREMVVRGNVPRTFPPTTRQPSDSRMT